MSESAERTISKQLTLFAADSLASLTVWPGSDEAQQMTATSGRSIAALLPSSDPSGCLARTFLESSPPCSTRCYLTWRVKVTPARRLLFRLWPSMPRTDGTGFSLLPTPMSTLGTHGGPNQRDSSGRPGLQMAARLWLTPRAIYGEHPGMRDPTHLTGQVQLWLTPSATNISRRSEAALEKRVAFRKSINRDTVPPGNLAEQVRYGYPTRDMWPTPRANERQQHNSGDDYVALSKAVKPWPTPTANRRSGLQSHGINAISGQLNPTWVEWLMGFPIGWTDLEHSETP